MSTRYVVVAMTYDRETADRIRAAAREAGGLTQDEIIELEPGEGIITTTTMKRALREVLEGV